MGLKEILSRAWKDWKNQIANPTPEMKSYKKKFLSPTVILVVSLIGLLLSWGFYFVKEHLDNWGVLEFFVDLVGHETAGLLIFIVGILLAVWFYTKKPYLREERKMADYKISMKKGAFYGVFMSALLYVAPYAVEFLKFADYPWLDEALRGLLIAVAVAVWNYAKHAELPYVSEPMKKVS